MSFLKDVGLPIEPKGFDVRGRRDAGKSSKECEEHLLLPPPGIYDTCHLLES